MKECLKFYSSFWYLFWLTNRMTFAIPFIPAGPSLGTRWMRPTSNSHYTHKNLVNPPTWYKQSQGHIYVHPNCSLPIFSLVPTLRVSATVHVQQAPALPKYRLAEEEKQIENTQTSKITTTKQVMNYITTTFNIFRGDWFSFFPLKTADNNAIKGNVKSRLRERSKIKEDLLHARRSFETHLQWAFPKPICTDLLCTPRNTEIYSTLQHLVSQLPEIS